MPTILITGSNRGIGLELARQYARDGWQVVATCRDPERAAELRGLAGDAQIHRLDVTDQQGVRDLAVKLGPLSIDLLVLNSGVNFQHGAPLSETAFDRWPATFATNVIGPVFVASTLLEHIARSERKTIVAMGSMAGSFKAAVAGSYLYRSSKAALHSAMKALAEEVRPRGITVVITHPGRVRGARTPDHPLPVEDSVAGMRRVIDFMTQANSGSFLDYEGRELPW